MVENIYLLIWALLSTGLAVCLISAYVYIITKVLPDYMARQKSSKIANYSKLGALSSAGGIIFLGDSITEGFPVSEIFQQLIMSILWHHLEHRIQMNFNQYWNPIT